MDEKIITFRTPNLILAGIGAIKRIGEEAKSLEAGKVLLVTDKGVAQSGVADEVKNLLVKESIGVDLYDKVISDPDIACAEACVSVVRENRYDLVVGVGGGSSMDIAAVASVMATNPGSVRDYLGINLVKKPGIPAILVPTTAGTGAEVTPNAILTDTQEKLKKAVVSPYIIPRVAIVDPVLTVSMPPSVTSSSGIDALTHAIESYTSVNATIMTDLFAREAIVMIGRSIRTAVAKGENLRARYDMSIGSLYAGISLANAGVTAVHALAYPIGGHYGVPHGVGCGLLLPYVMEFNVLGDVPKFAEIARLLGERVEGLTLLEQAYRSVDAVMSIYKDLVIPQSLTELGVPKEAIPGLAKAAINVTRLMKNNPRNMGEEDIRKIYEEAL